MKYWLHRLLHCEISAMQREATDWVINFMIQELNTCKNPRGEELLGVFLGVSRKL
ncbi:putative transposable element encoded protein [Trachipleistophora hominis]|uniref:Putative transposable element encoded protein n=1 Tax=Trachipleistophora hominis TaxID=72359 RepID=L7JWI2_TRAHO|nr:putative transposable element encoded protein [Trachipleistophora hominis]